QPLHVRGMTCLLGLVMMQCYGCWTHEDYCLFRQTFKDNRNENKNKDKNKKKQKQQQLEDSFRSVCLLEKFQAHLLKQLKRRSSTFPFRVFQITEFYRIATLQGLKYALVQYGPCLLVTTHYNNSSTFWRPSTK